MKTTLSAVGVWLYGLAWVVAIGYAVVTHTADLIEAVNTR